MRKARCRICGKKHEIPVTTEAYQLQCSSCATVTKIRPRSGAGNTSRKRKRKTRGRGKKSGSFRMPSPLAATLVALVAAILVALAVIMMDSSPIEVGAAETPFILAVVFGILIAFILVALFMSSLATIGMALIMAASKKHYELAPLRAYPPLVIILPLLVLLTAYLNKQDGRSFWSAIPLPERHQNKLNDFLAEAQDLASQSLDYSSTEKWPVVDETPKTNGDLGKVERLMKRWTNKLAAIKNGHLSIMEAIHYDTLLSPERLSEDSDFSQSKWMIGQARKSLARQQEQILSLANTSHNDIDKLDISMERKAAARMAYQKGMGKGLDVLSILSKAESETVDVQEKIIQHLATRRGFWEITDGQIVFSSDKDAQAHRSHVMRIQELAQTQDLTIRKTVEETLRDMERYRKP